jgi:RiboL-PSP-HEPN
MAQPPHVENLISNHVEVMRLAEIHATISGTGPGRRAKYDVEILNKSGIVLLVATWEAYIEDLAISAFDAVFAAASTCTVFPSKVLTLAARELRSSADERRVWELAGVGWRTVLQDHRQVIIDRYVGTMNTPKPEQVDGLFSELIGLSALSSHWHWIKTNSDQAKKRLTDLVELRGDIAHRVKTSRTVTKGEVLKAQDFTSRLAAVSSNQVRKYVHTLTNKYPWGEVRFEGTA